jgi:diacylglycerol O-acyltransferase-1
VGFSKSFAVTMVFLFSAIMHEVLISIPFKYFALHAFAGMLIQAPMITVTKYVDKMFNGNAFIGNAIFWCAFCVLGKATVVCNEVLSWYVDSCNTGQPMGVILYHYDLSQNAAHATAGIH